MLSGAEMTRKMPFKAQPRSRGEFKGRELEPITAHYIMTNYTVWNHP